MGQKHTVTETEVALEGTSIVAARDGTQSKPAEEQYNPNCRCHLNSQTHPVAELKGAVLGG